jgi:hypothetical protein
MKYAYLILVSCLFFPHVYAQGDSMMSMHHMAHMEHGSGQGMSSAFSLHLPMSRNGSGTAWLPDAAPVYAFMFHSKKWMYMLHGNIFIRYNDQDVTNKGSRGGAQWDTPDMLMFMGQCRLGARGLFHFSTMFSLDALATGTKGYPLMFQTGETSQGRPLVDRQHPHDLFSELSVSYAYAASNKADLFIYLAYPGEPALGPVTFMHRPSGMGNPDATLSHHWTDATHITFGVATIGFRYAKFKVEGSSFTGREPNEDRYDFDKPRFDSWSTRLSFNPNKNWALQVSHGFLKSPEALHPLEDIHRTTASASASYPLGSGRSLDGTVLWGMNKEQARDAQHAALAELSLRLKRWLTYTRYEWVQKSAEELDLDEVLYSSNTIFPVNAFTLGASYDFLTMPFRAALGAQGALYHSSHTLDILYGKTPVAIEFYLHVYPRLIK